MLLLIVLCFTASCVYTSAFLFNSPITVHTPVGNIRGTSTTVSGKTINTFYGIPYAEAPTMDRRFQKPVPKAKFTATVDATDKLSAHSCPSNRQQSTIMSEDCLILTIYAPGNASRTSKVPVMIWIHGGGFTAGSSSSYDGTAIAGQGVIVVTINYRLAQLGFMSTSSGFLKGNYGLWDQHMAIQWVHDNIESFGGNPNNVTIFGESAGSSSVIYQALFPGNKGLFHRVIAESGSSNSPWAYKNNNISSLHAHRFAEHCGCHQSTDDAMLACLRQLSSATIVASVADYWQGYQNNDYAWTVAADGEFVSTDQWRMFIDSNTTATSLEFFRNLDLLMGVNKADGELYLYDWDERFGYKLATKPVLTAQQFNDIILPVYLKFGKSFGPVDTAFKGKVYNFYASNDNHTMVRNLVQFSTDVGFTAPSVQTLNAHITRSSRSTYMYEFAYSPSIHILPVIPSIDDGTMANHADELNFVFGAAEFDGIPEDFKLSKTMITMWTNFAKSGNPNIPVSFTQDYDVTWSEYSALHPNYLEMTINMTSSSLKQDLSGPAVRMLLNG